MQFVSRIWELRLANPASYKVQSCNVARSSSIITRLNAFPVSVEREGEGVKRSKRAVALLLGLQRLSTPPRRFWRRSLLNTPSLRKINKNLSSVLRLLTILEYYLPSSSSPSLAFDSRSQVPSAYRKRSEREGAYTSRSTKTLPDHRPTNSPTDWEAMAVRRVPRGG